MIYPYNLPENVESEAERKVFDYLDRIKDKYDIFYSRSFLGRAKFEKKEYEIDFIIVKKPDRRKNYTTIISMEVKGGILEYDGIKNHWTQNGKTLPKGPDKQATSASHSLINRYKEIANDVNMEWIVCFPDCELPSNTALPSNLNENKIIDRNSAIYIDEALESIINKIERESTKGGCPYYVYENFKKELLRGVGFVETLSAQFRYEDKRFVELTNEQIDTFHHISSNNKILVRGYAGTGKTIVAIAAAQDKVKEEKSVLFLCYNRTLANKIRYRFNKDELNIKVTTFHSLAREIIEEVEPGWWKNNQQNEEEFWSLTVPVKLDSIIKKSSKIYDAIIIDEGQDFEDLWFESIFKLSHIDTSFVVFTDKRQNIFERNGILPDQDSFMKFDLIYNCRNTKSITSELAGIIDENIQSHRSIPKGESITRRSFKDEKALCDALISEISILVKNHNIKPEQILIMTNSQVNESSIKNLWKIGSLDVTGLDRSGRFNKGKIHYSSINMFKGLEIDILFIIDDNLIKDKNISYTQISRAKNKAYIFSINI